MRALQSFALLTVATTAAAQTVRYDFSDRPRARWSLSARPLVQIGGASGTGPAEFSRIVGVSRLTDGTLVVADAGSYELRHFSASAQFIALIARKGRGPGELRELDGLINVGDTLIAFEGREALHVFTTRNWLRSWRRPPFAGHIVQTPQAALRPDVSVWWARTGSEQPVRATVDSSYVVRIDADSSVHLVAALPPAPTYGLPGVRSTFPLGFSPGAHVTARGERICMGYASVYLIRCVDGEGRSALTIERQVRPQSVSARDRVAFRRARSGLREDGTSRYEGSLRVHRERVAAAAQFASHYPAYSQLLFANNGDLWVREYAMEDGLIVHRWRSNRSPSK